MTSGAQGAGEPIVIAAVALPDAVPDEGPDTSPDADATAALEAAALSDEELAVLIEDLRVLVDDKTGVPQVDAALEQLADLDPLDFAGSAQILSDVLQRLESALGGRS